MAYSDNLLISLWYVEAQHLSRLCFHVVQTRLEPLQNGKKSFMALSTRRRIWICRCNVIKYSSNQTKVKLHKRVSALNYQALHKPTAEFRSHCSDQQEAGSCDICCQCVHPSVSGTNPHRGGLTLPLADEDENSVFILHIDWSVSHSKSWMEALSSFFPKPRARGHFGYLSFVLTSCLFISLFKLHTSVLHSPADH